MQAETNATQAAANSLQGKTLFITGASRGIGLAIAKRAAADSANIVIVAKTTDTNPSCPAPSTALPPEIEAAGGRALPLAVDIRDEAAVLEAVAKAVETNWRHRHPGQQRQRHQPDRHRSHAREAL